MYNLDVLFVSPNNSGLYQGLANQYSAIEPPTWALLLAESCRQKGFSVGILDTEAERLSSGEAAEQIKDIHPKLVCFVAYGQNPNSGTTSMSSVIDIADTLKFHYPYKVMVIGSHASALPQEVLGYDCIDFVAINEGVKCLYQLLQTNLEKELHKVAALGWKQDGHITLNSADNSLILTEQLDQELPGYAWDLLPYKEKPLDLYRSHFWHTNYDHTLRTPFAALYTSLGCQFTCSYCMINIVNRTSTQLETHAAQSNTMRFWSPNKVISWFEELIEKYGCTTIRISDEMFFLNKKYYEPILNGLIERGYGDIIRTWTYARVDSINERFLELYRKAGVKWLGVGIESGNRMVRQEVTKGKFQNKDIYDIVRDTEKYGINVAANYIVGLPTDTHQTMQETLDLGIELNTAFFNVYCALALPGSPLYWTAKKNKWEIPTQYSQYGFYSYDHLPLRTETLSAAEVVKFRDEAWQKYFTNPVYLNKIESVFGSNIKNNIVEQSQVKLKRKLLGD